MPGCGCPEAGPGCATDRRRPAKFPKLRSQQFYRPPRRSRCRPCRYASPGHTTTAGASKAGARRLRATNRAGKSVTSCNSQCEAGAPIDRLKRRMLNRLNCRRLCGFRRNVRTCLGIEIVEPTRLGMAGTLTDKFLAARITHRRAQAETQSAYGSSRRQFDITPLAHLAHPAVFFA